MSHIIGIESAFGFGDCCFNIPLIEAVSKHFNSDISISTRKSCADAFINIPCVKEIVHINNLYEGIAQYEKRGIPSYQITQNAHFLKYCDEIPGHSLALTSHVTGKKLFGIDYDPKPFIRLNDIEKSLSIDASVKNVAIESEYYSYQSWASDSDFEKVIKCNPHVSFWWMSIRKPDFHYDNMIYASSIYSRRECISIIRQCDVFISVGSGLFCATLGEEIQPSQIWMLWIDDLYKYKKTISELNWLKSTVTWFHDRKMWEEFDFFLI